MKGESLASWRALALATSAGLLLTACSGQTPSAGTAQNAADTEAAGQRSGPPNLPSLATAPAADPAIRTAPVVPGRAGRVFIFAGVDKNCTPLPEPQVSVTDPPQKGDISFRPGQPTTIAASAQGTCLGVQATGTGVYYTAHAGASGSDAFSVTARLASGETMTRQFQVQITQ